MGGCWDPAVAAATSATSWAGMLMWGSAFCPLMSVSVHSSRPSGGQSPGVPGTKRMSPAAAQELKATSLGLPPQALGSSSVQSTGAAATSCPPWRARLGSSLRLFVEGGSVSPPAGADPQSPSGWADERRCPSSPSLLASPFPSPLLSRTVRIIIFFKSSLEC